MINHNLKWLFASWALFLPTIANAGNLFECRAGLIEGSDASAFLAIQDSGKVSLDWFEQKRKKFTACRLSIVGAKYSARAHTNDITFEFEKDVCESQSKNSVLDVRSEGFLKISTSTTGGYISHLLMFHNAQPVACDIEKIDRKALEALAQKSNLNRN